MPCLLLPPFFVSRVSTFAGDRTTAGAARRITGGLAPTFIPILLWALPWHFCLIHYKRIHAFLQWLATACCGVADAQTMAAAVQAGGTNSRRAGGGRLEWRGLLRCNLYSGYKPNHMAFSLTPA